MFLKEKRARKIMGDREQFTRDWEERGKFFFTSHIVFSSSSRKVKKKLLKITWSGAVSLLSRAVQQKIFVNTQKMKNFSKLQLSYFFLLARNDKDENNSQTRVSNDA